MENNRSVKIFKKNYFAQNKDINMPKVSVIIPVYNAAPFLRQCLNSIMRQTLSDIEIILVDDGSTDGSNTILNEYAAQDNRLSIISQENKGAGAARNAGLRTAAGKYLFFPDADDFFELEMLEKLYNICEETGADIAIFKANAYDNQKGEITGDLGWTSFAGIPDKPLFSYKDVERFYQCCSSVAWDKFFRRSFVESNGIFFQEIRFCNDVYFVHTLLCLTEKITAINERFVTYRQNIPTSIFATSKNNPLCFYQSIEMVQNKLKTFHHYYVIEKSYSNWAGGFCLFHLLSRKNSDSGVFRITYKALQDYIFDKLGVKDRTKDFFYDGFLYDQIQKIVFTPLDDYYFDAVLDRNRLRIENNQIFNEGNRLQNALDYSEKECGRLQSALNWSDGERSRLQGVLDWLEGERGKLQGALDWSEGECDRLQNEMDSLQGERDRLQEERDHLQGERNCLQEERNQLQGERDQLQGERDQLQGEKKQLQGERNTLLASRSYRLGRMLTWFPRKIRAFFRCLKQNGLIYTIKLLVKKSLGKTGVRYDV
jgi:glycosyltransferase involved in cell wall biosynthesis/FtsZ-binding cell division protein ZapB